jgi:hypothetical protein
MYLEHFLISSTALLNRPVWRARASRAGGGTARRGTRGIACGDRGIGTCLLSPPAPAGDAQDQRAIRVPADSHPPWCEPCGRASRVQIGSRPICLWVTLGGQAKTNSPGASLDSQRLARRANPRGLPWRSRGKRVSREGHPGLVGAAGGAAPQGVCKSNSPAGRDPLQTHSLPKAASFSSVHQR